ncbi:tetratricopeptide repeat protein [Candidatus Gracilibacteria bacterium]|nr:tetratricopeptide repeat protein [Candidatus Gracilibacteria bacterium]
MRYSHRLLLSIITLLLTASLASAAAPALSASWQNADFKNGVALFEKGDLYRSSAAFSLYLKDQRAVNSTSLYDALKIAAIFMQTDKAQQAAIILAPFKKETIKNAEDRCSFLTLSLLIDYNRDYFDDAVKKANVILGEKECEEGKMIANFAKYVILPDKKQYDKALESLDAALLSVSFVQELDNLSDGLKKLIQESPQMTVKSPSRYVLLATLYREDGQFAKAKMYINRALALDRNYIPAYYAQHLIYYDQHNFKKAIEVLKKAEAIDPNYHVIKNSLGFLTYEMVQDGELSEAEYATAKKYLEESIALNPDGARPHNTLGVIAQLTGDPQTARVYFEKAIKLGSRVKNSKYSKPTANLAQSYLDQGDYKSALTYFKKAGKINPDSADIQKKIGTIYLEQKQYPEALAAYSRAQQLDPTSTEIRGEVANIYYYMGNVDAAIAEIKEALENDKNNAYLYFALSTGYSEKKETEKAEKALKKAEKLDPTLAAVRYYKKGEELFKLRQFDDALVAFDQALRINPSHYNALVKKADTLAGLERYDEAERIINRELELHPKDSVFRMLLGKVFHFRGQYDAALVEFDRALKDVPSSNTFFIGEVYYMQGLSYLRKKQYDVAEKFLSLSVENNPGNALSHLYLSNALYRLGRKAEAISSVKRALELDPTLTLAQDYLNKISQ